MKIPAEASRSEASSDASQPLAVMAAEVLGPSAVELARAELRRHLAAWVKHEPGARRGSDPEELHQLRVTARRIEATLGVFKHQLPPRVVHARKATKGVVRALGAVRDFDVQLSELEQYCAELPAVERAAAAPLQRRLEAERARTRIRMLGVLDSEATRHWLETLNEAGADPNAADGQQAVSVLPERIRTRFRKLRKEVRKLDARSEMHEYHSVRRRAKQLRYAIESGAGLFAKPADEMLKQLRRLQDQLGAHQDADMAKNRLAALAMEDLQLPPQTLFLMGRLAEHHVGETREARKTLARAWRKVNGKRWRALRSRMQELSDTAALVQLAAGPQPPPAEPPADDDVLRPLAPSPGALSH
jgi:CHAD domain-containing protein